MFACAMCVCVCVWVNVHRIVAIVSHSISVEGKWIAIAVKSKKTQQQICLFDIKLWSDEFATMPHKCVWFAYDPRTFIPDQFIYEKKVTLQTSPNCPVYVKKQGDDSQWNCLISPIFDRSIICRCVQLLGICN